MNMNSLKSGKLGAFVLATVILAIGFGVYVWWPKTSPSSVQIAASKQPDSTQVLALPSSPAAAASCATTNSISHNFSPDHPCLSTTHFSDRTRELVNAIEAGRAVTFSLDGQARRMLLKPRRSFTAEFQLGLGADHDSFLASSVRMFTGFTPSDRRPVLDSRDRTGDLYDGEDESHSSVYFPQNPELSSTMAAVTLAVVNGAVGGLVREPDGGFIEVWTDPGSGEIKAATWGVDEFQYDCSIDGDGIQEPPLATTRTIRSPTDADRDQRAVVVVFAVDEEGGDEPDMAAVNAASDKDPSTGYYSRSLDITPRGSLYEASLKRVPILWVMNKNRTGPNTEENLAFRASRMLSFFGHVSLIYESQMGMHLMLQELVMIPDAPEFQPDFGVTGSGGTKLGNFRGWTLTYRNQGSYGWHGAIGFPNTIYGGMAWVSTFPGNYSVGVVDDWSFVIPAHEFGHNCGAYHTAGGIMNAYVSNSRDFYTWYGSITAAQQMYNRCNVRGYDIGIMRNPAQTPWAIADNYSTPINTVTNLSPLVNDMTKTVCGTIDNVLRIAEVSRVTPSEAGTLTFSTNSITFTPALDYEGMAWFSYTLQGSVGNGGQGWMHKGDVAMTVGSDTRQAQTISVPAGKTVEFMPSPGVSSISVQAAQADISKDIHNSVIVVRADATASGTDQFTYISGSTPYDVVITYIMPEPLVAIDDVISCNQKSGTIRINPLSNDYGTGNRLAPDNVDVVFAGHELDVADKADQNMFAADSFSLVSVSNLTTALGALGAIETLSFVNDGIRVYQNTGHFSFTPIAGTQGVARLEYVVRDAMGNTDTGMVYVILPLLSVDEPSDIAPTTVNIHEASDLVVRWSPENSTDWLLSGSVQGRCEVWASPTNGVALVSATHNTETVATFSAPGNYTLRVTGEDNGYETYQTLLLAVHSATNLPGSGNIGGYGLYSNGTVSVSSASYDLGTMDLTVVDDGVSGLPFSTLWTLQDGPSEVSFDDASLTNAIVTFQEPGSYTLRLFMDDGKLVTCQDFDFSVSITPAVLRPPRVVNTTASSIQHRSASCGGDLTSKGSASPIAVMLYYGLIDGGDNPANWSNNVSAGNMEVGLFAQAISGIEQNSTYYYRFYASGADGSYWADASQWFTTENWAPVVDSDRGAVSVTESSATLYGLLDSDGEAATIVTLCYGDNDAEEALGNWDTTLSLGTRTEGLLSRTVSNLTSSTSYVYRYSASNAYGVAWSEPQTFFTRGLYPVINNGNGVRSGEEFATEIEGWLVSTGASATAVSVYYGTADGGDSAINWTDSFLVGAMNEGMVSATLSGLTHNTRYYYRFYATNDTAGVMAPETDSFVTPNPRPMILNHSSSELSYRDINLVGNLITTGGAPTTVTIFYGTVNGGSTPGNWEESLSFSADHTGYLTNAVSGLSDNTLYYWRYYATNALGDEWSYTTGSFTTPDAQPYIETRRAETFSTNSATVPGYLSATGDSQTVVWLHYGLTNGTTTTSSWQYSVSLGTQSEGDVFAEISNLAVDTRYHYRFRAVNNSYTNWADSSDWFKTQNILDLGSFENNLRIRFDGYDREETLRDFPVLVVLDTSITNFSYSGFLSSPWNDLRFADDNGVELLYEVEQWDTEGKSYIWVQVPALTQGMAIWAYWGNTALSAPSYATNGAAWRDYAAVYHLNELASTREDSTVNDRHGEPVNDVTSATGMISGGAEFDGSGDWIDIPNNFGQFGNLPVSISFWQKRDVIDAESRVVFGAGGENNMFITYGDTLPNDTLGWRISDGSWKTPVAISGMQTGRWTYVTATWDPSTGYLMYADGAQVSSSSLTAGRSVRSGDNNLGSLDGTSRYFDGLLDEVRVSEVVRSSSWIWAVYYNMASNSMFNSYWMPQAGPRNIVVSRSSISIPEGSNATFNVRLDWAPLDDVTVDVSRIAGDTDISVSAGASLVFTPLNWQTGQDVTLLAAADSDWQSDSAWFACTAVDANASTVTATEVDYTSFLLPFLETFDPPVVSNASTLGELHGQHGWDVTDTSNAVVQNADAAIGTQSLRMNETSVQHTFTGTASHIWMQMFQKPIFNAVLQNIPTNATVAYCVGESGQIIVSSGSNEFVVTDVLVIPDVWTRFTTEIDYVADTWSLWRNTTKVADGLGTIVDRDFLESIGIINTSTNMAFFDQIRVNTSALGLGIGVYGPTGFEICSGDDTAGTADGSDLGSTVIGQLIEATFTLTNAALTTLSLTGTPLVELVGADTGKWSISVEPTSSVPVGGTTTFTLRYLPLQEGVHPVTVRIVTSEPGQENYTFGVSAEGLPGPLVFVGETVVKADGVEDVLYSGTLADDATEPSASGTRTFSKVSGPAWLSVATDGTLSGTPLNADTGVNSFTVQVDGSISGSDQATLQITVSNVNDAPIFTSDPIILTSVGSGQTYINTIADSATDPDVGDTLSFSKLSGPTWLAVASNGVVSGTPAASDEGVNSWIVEVSDGNGGTDTTTLQIMVTTPPPQPATGAVPGNGATDVSLIVDLSWTVGAGATSHDVYFGTNLTPDSGDFQGNQSGTTFDVGTLSPEITHYWRIDELNAGGVTTGAVWNFTTEALPVAQFEIPTGSGLESTSTVINVVLDKSPSLISSVNYGVTGGSATSPDDFALSGSYVIFNPGETVMPVSIDIVDDYIDEPNETIELTLSGPQNVTLGGGITHTYTIENDDGNFEADTVTASNDWTTVALVNDYTSTPVVVCTLAYAANTVPVVIRVRSVTTNSFEVKLQNPGDGSAIVADTVHYLAMAQGAWLLPDGTRIEAALVVSDDTNENSDWLTSTAEAYIYQHTYTSDPAVLGQVMTYNDAEWSSFWCCGNDRKQPPSISTCYVGKEIGEDTYTSRATETLGVIVVESTSNGSLGDGVAFQSGLGADSVLGIDNSPPYSYGLTAGLFDMTPQIGLVTQAAMDGGNGGWAYLYGSTPLSTSTVNLVIDEDQTKDSERGHISEQVGYFIIEEAVYLSLTPAQ